MKCEVDNCSSLTQEVDIMFKFNIDIPLAMF